MPRSPCRPPPIVHAQREPATPDRFAVCIRNDGYPAALELHRLYRILPDDAGERCGLVRVVDESGEGYLYSSDFFHHVAPLPMQTVPLPDGTGLRFAPCIENDGWKMDLALLGIHAVLPDPSAEEDGYLRVIDRTGEDYLYPATAFQLVDVPEELKESLLRGS